MLDFDEEAFQEELKGALSSTSPTVMPLESEVEPLTPVTTLPDPFTAFDITASKEAQVSPEAVLILRQRVFLCFLGNASMGANVALCDVIHEKAFMQTAEKLECEGLRVVPS